MRVRVPLHQLAHGRVGLQQPGAVPDEPGQPARAARSRGRRRRRATAFFALVHSDPDQVRTAGCSSSSFFRSSTRAAVVRVGAQGVHVGAQPGVVGAAQLVPRVGCRPPRGSPAARRRRGRTPGRRPSRAPRTGEASPSWARKTSRFSSQEAGQPAQRRPTAPPGGGRPRRPAPAPAPRTGAAGVACSLRSTRSATAGSRSSSRSSSARAVTSGRRRRRPAAPRGRARRGRRRAGRARRWCVSFVLDDGAGQEVLLHEGAQARADLVLLARDDRGVRDRQPERVPEQRGDGEPVGQRADHRGLGGGPHVADPGAGVPAEQHAGEEDERRPAEQPGGQPLHPGEVAGPLRVVERRRRAGRRSGSGTLPSVRTPAAAARGRIQAQLRRSRG